MEVENLIESLREIREERGMTLDELAKMTNLSSAYLSRIERGERKSPSINVLEKISQALGISIGVTEDTTLDEEFRKITELIIMYRKKGNINLRETIEILEIIENIIKGVK